MLGYDMLLLAAKIGITCSKAYQWMLPSGYIGYLDVYIGLNKIEEITPSQSVHDFLFPYTAPVTKETKNSVIVFDEFK